MRIVHTCLRYPPATGGVETYVKSIVEHTRNIEQGYDVRVLTSAMRTHGPISLLSPDRLLDDPMYIQRLHAAATPLLSYPRLQALNYYLGHHQPDIIHGYSFWYQPADVAARYARHHHIPYIFHPMYYTNAIRQKPVWQLYKKTIGQGTFAAADVVGVLSPFEQQLIEKEGFPVKRFMVIPPALDTQAYLKPRPNPFSKHGISGPILLTVGRVAKSKRLDMIIAALPRLEPTVQLVIIGEDFGAKKTLQKQAEEAKVVNRIHWLGRLPREELMAAYQHADVLVHASDYEAFGIVLIEALAAGTPVIARRRAAIPSVVPDEAGLLFEDLEELISSLNQVLKNETKRQTMGQAGQKSIAERFSWEQNSKKLRQLYGELREKYQV